MDFVRRVVLALVPLGVAMWAAHLLYHFVTGWNAPWFVISQRFFTSAISISSGVPNWLTAAQIVLLDAGLLTALYIAWRTAKQYVLSLGSAFAMTVPWSALALALYCAGVWTLFQPMQMRGMMH